MSKKTDELIDQLQLLEKVKDRLISWESDGFIYKRYANESQLRQYDDILREIGTAITRLEDDLPDGMIADDEFVFY